MARLMIAIVVAFLFFGGIIAADQALNNPDLEPADAGDAEQQETFIESTAPFLEVGGPIALFALVIGTVLGAVRAVGGG